LEWRGTTFPVRIYKHGDEMRIIYRQAKQYTQYVPFAIEIQVFTPNTAHIHNIHKTAAIPGSQMVHFALAVCRKLGAKEAELVDAAEVMCAENDMEMSLSLLTLLRTGDTFYERFGFEMTPKTRKQRLVRKLAQFRKITVSMAQKKFAQAIRVLERAQKDPATFELREPGRGGYPDIYTRDPVKTIPQLLTTYKQIHKKLEKSKCDKLADFLSYSARHTKDCAVYTEFLRLGFSEQRIVYRGKEVIVNKWSNLLEEIARNVAGTLKYKF